MLFLMSFASSIFNFDGLINDSHSRICLSNSHIHIP